MTSIQQIEQELDDLLVKKEAINDWINAVKNSDSFK